MKKTYYWSFICLFVYGFSLYADVMPSQLKAWEYPIDIINRLWLDTACGDINGDGIDEIILLKARHSQVIVLSAPADASYSSIAGWDIEADADCENLIGLTAGDFDGDGIDEVAILRNAPSPTPSNLLIYKMIGGKMSLIASCKIGSGNYDWVDIASGDFDGDGKNEIVVCKKDWSQFIFYKLSGSTIVSTASINIDTVPANNDWRAIDAGDFDGDGKDELIAVRKAPAGLDDITFWKKNSSNWKFNLMGSYNLNNGSNHYNWLDVTAGNFVPKATPGEPEKDEFVLYKNQHSHFIYCSGYTSMTVLGSKDYISDIAYPWKGIDAGNTVLNNGLDEVVSVRQTPAYGDEMSLAMFGDENTKYTEKLNRLQGSNGFSFACYYQWNTRDTANLNALNTTQLRQFCLDNDIQTFNFLISDNFGDPIANPSIKGREYKSLMDFLEKTKNDNIKVIATIISPWEGVTLPNYAPHPENSPYITGDERLYFKQLPNGDPDPFDMVGWFELFGIIAKKYPHLVAVAVDDFSQDTTTFTPEYLGKMIKALRANSQEIAFIPILYYGHVLPARDFLRNYTDGFMFYFQNAKYKDPTLVAGDIVRYPTNTGWNMHGGISLQENYLEEEVADVRDWLANSNRILLVGVYAKTHSMSTTAATPATTQGLVASTYSNMDCDGVMVYTTQDPASETGDFIYDLFNTWSTTSR